MKKVIIPFILLFWGYTVVAQDVRFSQLQSSPLMINPSLTGVFEQDYRLIANYRTQWKNLGTPYQTLSFSAELKPVKQSPRSKTDLATGILLMSDKAGDLDFMTNLMYLSLAGRIYLNRSRTTTQYLSAGFQFGYQSYSIDWTKLQVEFPSQVLVGFEKTGHFDGGVGLTWVYATDRYLLYAGGALYHFKSLQNSLRFDGTSSLSPRYVGHLGTEFKLNSSTTLLLSGFYQRQGNAREILVGGSFRFGGFQNDEESSLYLGTWYRIDDALVFSVRWALANLSFTISYDATTSNLAEANNSFGALELGTIYTGILENRSYREGKVQCPTF